MTTEAPSQEASQQEAPGLIALALIEEARTWIGTHWMLNQCNKGVAVDCLRLIHAVYKEVGYDLGEVQPYPRRPVPMAIESYMDALGIFDKVAIDSIEDFYLGDILVFNIRGIPHHIALYAGASKMIHSSDRYRGVVESELSDWMGHLALTYRLKELNKKAIIDE